MRSFLSASAARVVTVSRHVKGDRFGFNINRVNGRHQPYRDAVKKASCDCLASRTGSFVQTKC